MPKSIKFKTNWDYSPAPESTSHIRLKKKYELFINGKFIPPIENKYFETINPANEEVIAEVALASKKILTKQCNRQKMLTKKFGQKYHRRKKANIFSE